MDEIEFFKYMLNDLEKTYSIDTGRVYATGHSWGSQMTHVLALNEPEMFAAVAPLSGFIFNAAVFEQVEAAKAKGSYPGVRFTWQQVPKVAPNGQSARFR